MFSEKDKKQIEEEINNVESNKFEEDVQIDISSKAKLKSEFGRGFNNKFKNLQIRYKKDKRKVLVAIAGLLAMFSALMGSSYAYLTYVSKTDNSITINAGQLALVFQNETNTINLTNAVPVKDGIGLDSDKEYSFQVKNNGSIPGAYKITLDNTCETGNEVDVCIPDEYIKVGLKVGNNSYKVVERNDKNEYILDTGSLQKGAFNTYKMKIWLDHETPNIYNATGSKNIVYKGKLGLSYEQGIKSNLLGEISNANYTVTHFQNRTTSEIKNDGSFDGLTNQPYFRINAVSSSSVDTAWNITSSSPISIVEGNQYLLSFYVRSENAAAVQYIDYRDVNQSMTKIVWSTGAESKLSEIKNFDNDGQWHLITETFTVPSGVTSATINIGNDMPNLYGSGAYIDIANIKFTDK